MYVLERTGEREQSQSMTKEEQEAISIIGETDYRDIHKVFGIRQADRRYHLYVIGKTGPGKSTLLAGLAPIEHRGAFMAVNGMALRMGQTLGPPLMGLVFGIWGMESTFYAAAAVAGIMLVLATMGVRKRRKTDGH